MLIPRFSIRLMLLITTVCAVICLIATFAAGGSKWAFAIMSSIAALALLMAVFALMFTVSFLLLKTTSLARPRVKTASPFATDALPPQVIPPTDPD